MLTGLSGVEFIILCSGSEEEEEEEEPAMH